MNKEYQKPELTVKSLVSKTEFAADNKPETVLSATNPDDWFEWDQ